MKYFKIFLSSGNNTQFSTSTVRNKQVTLTKIYANLSKMASNKYCNLQQH